MDIITEINATTRALRAGRIAAGEGRAVVLERTYRAPIDDVWSAVTDPERVGRWFLPLTVEPRIGGRYQLEGNAGGQILACERPHRLRVTWVFGEPQSERDISEVEVRLTATDEETTQLVLEHAAITPPEMWDQFGPGAVGVGWDMVLLGLGLHLQGGSVGDPVAWQLSEEGRSFAITSSERWGDASVAGGTDPEAARRGVENTTQFYAPDPPGEGGAPDEA